MSTKNLARTVIEGGRGRASHGNRQLSHGIARAAARHAMNVAYRADRLDELVVPVDRRHDTYFVDKLGPARRWLASQAGRPWDKVRGEIFERFDTRTTAGRHIVHCHLLDWVEESARFYRPEFHVDARGILRQVVPPTRRRAPALPRPHCELERWLGGRLVGARGQTLFWFVLTASGAYRQERRLEDDDARLWRSLPLCFRNEHSPFPPARN